MSDSESELERALTEIVLLQSMIDNIEEHLKGLRTQCAPNDEFTQKEIRVTEVKNDTIFTNIELLFLFVLYAPCPVK